MNVTEIREALTSVSDAVPVPAPDRARLRAPGDAGRRRRRTAGRVAGAVAAVAVVASRRGRRPALGGDEPTHRTDAGRPPSVAAGAGPPVLVEGRSASRRPTTAGLGPAGPAAARRSSATTPHGRRRAHRRRDAGPGRRAASARAAGARDAVRTAYLDGDAVVFENLDGLVRWWGIDPTVRVERQRPDRARPADGGGGRHGGDRPGHGVDAARRRRGPRAVPRPRGRQRRPGRRRSPSGVVAVRTDVGVELLPRRTARFGSGLPGDRIGALAPDGHALRPARREPAWRSSCSTRAPRNATPVEGPSRHRGRPRLVRPGRAARRGPGRRGTQPVALLGPGHVVHRAAARTPPRRCGCR